MQSKCKRMSGDSMSCVSCHDPHYSPPPEERTAFYRKKCLACHSSANFAASHFPDNPDCTSCHLPKGKAAQVPHIAWTDHRIRKRYDQPEAHFNAWGGTGLAPLLTSRADSRDLALAYYDVVAGGNGALFTRALQLATESYAKNPTDIPVLKALGYLRQLKGDNAAAIELYRQVLKLNPVDPWAANNLAMLVAKAGQVAEAEALWQQTFSRNETTDQIGLNLAIAQCMLGKKSESAETLQRVLHYSPDNRVARQRLAEIQGGTELCSTRTSPRHE